MRAQRLALLVLAVLSAAFAVWGAAMLAQAALGVLLTPAGPGSLRVHAAVSLLLAIGHALLLALPLILLLERWRPLTRAGAFALAVLIAVVPLALWGLPGRAVPAHTTTVIREGSRVVALILDGVPTRAAWLRSAARLLGLAILGAIGAEVYWRVRQAGSRALAVVAGRR